MFSPADLLMTLDEGVVESFDKFQLYWIPVGSEIDLHIFIHPHFTKSSIINHKVIKFEAVANFQGYLEFRSWLLSDQKELI
jgi:hypothetical protein